MHTREQEVASPARQTDATAAFVAICPKEPLKDGTTADARLAQMTPLAPARGI